MLTDQFQSSVRSDLGNRIEIVAAQEDAEINELYKA